MNTIRAKLSVMMFLELFIWSAWFNLLGLYLGPKFLNFDVVQAGWIFNAFAIAALTGMFLGGQLADRYFAQERFLAFSHFVGGIALLLMPYQKGFWPLFALMLLHSFFYVPTLSITNSIAFANLKDAQKEYGYVRVWGTLGWIAAAWPSIFIPLDWEKVPSIDKAGGIVPWLGTALSTLKTGPDMEAALSHIFTVGGVASLVMAASCLLLPHTPPAKREGSAFAPFEALKLLVVPTILVLFVVTLLDALVHNCYFVKTSPFLESLGVPINWIQPAMSIGQVAELATMAWLGYFLKRLGWRLTMIIGILGHVVRFALYSLGAHYGGASWITIVILSNVVHGFAYAFFFATVYIFVDENFPKDARTSAQSLFNLLILGIGPFVGGFLWNGLGATFSEVVEGKTVVNYTNLFLVPTVLGLVSAIVLIGFFHPRTAVRPEEVPVEAPP